jgi:hypothetical protein
MLSKVFSIAFGAITLAGFCSANASAADEFHWGEAVNGLELGVSLDASNNVLHCQVRNATNEDVAYNDYYFGRGTCLKMEVREGTNWVEFKDFGMALVPGPGPESCAAGATGKTRLLQPGEVLTNTQQRLNSFPLYRPSERDQWLSKHAQEDTFLINLAGSRWPKDMSDISAHEFRIGQSFGVADKMFSPLTTAYSPPFSLPAMALQPIKSP